MGSQNILATSVIVGEEMPVRLQQISPEDQQDQDFDIHLDQVFEGGNKQIKQIQKKEKKSTVLQNDVKGS